MSTQFAHHDERVLVLYETGLSVFERYAQAVQAIQALLKERFGRTWSIISSQGQDDAVWDQLDADISSGSGNVECAARVFDIFEAKEWTMVAAEQGGRQQSRIQLKPSSRNLLFVYPKDRVAFVRIPVWRNDRIDHESLCLVESDEAFVRFVEKVQIRSSRIHSSSAQHLLPIAELGILTDREMIRTDRKNDPLMTYGIDSLQYKYQRDCS